MPSTFSWLDYSEADRRRMLDVVNLFSERDTRDELGLGNVRDAFSDLLFPGTSTIQTRARYFLFIPWIYRRLERDGVRSADIARRARQDEVRLIDSLLRGDETASGAGVIGRDARSTLQRLPSSVYWQGLGVWGLRLYDGSVDQYHRSLDRYYDASRHRRSMRGVDDDLLDEPVSANWHASLPDAPADFLERTTFNLTAEEAEYLAERVRICLRHSLLAHLLDCELPATTNFPWETPAAQDVPAPLAEQIVHARLFSEVTHGAPLLYNLMLAELTDRDDLVANYRTALQYWAARLQGSGIENWNLGAFWRIVDGTRATISTPTRRFIERWIEIVRQPGVAARAAEMSELRALVRERETMLKRQLSRLTNPRARELWNGNSGAAQMTYRWVTAQRMLADIQAGLGTR